MSMEPPATDPEPDSTTARVSVGAGGMALWIILLANLAWFVPFALSTGAGIVESVLHARSVAGHSGGADAGGVQWGLMNLVGPLLLGLALAYGLYRYHSRNRRLDAEAEIGAQDQYDRPKVGKLDS